MDRPARVAGKVAIVTGAASGIGHACARQLAHEGALVVLADRNVERGQAAAEELGAPHRFAQLEVTDEEGWTRLVDEVVARAGRLDILVNGAGIGLRGSIETATLADLRQMWAVNVEGVFLGCRAAFAVMKAQGSGSLINLSSIAGIVGDADLAGYCASKGAVRMLSKSIALSGAKVGVRCNSVHPSFIDTPMVEELARQWGGSPKIRERLAQAAPMGRLGTAQEVAHLVVFLASDESAFITGAELTIDGGLSAR
ncbi:MAG: glucose 1-dehydrogenase [Myxococcales bacterium]|nr:glucose 1-dehydrogenase [Myxococcales bacterium]